MFDGRFIGLVLVVAVCACEEKADQAAESELTAASAAPAPSSPEPPKSEPPKPEVDKEALAKKCGSENEEACKAACDAGHARSCTILTRKLQQKWLLDQVTKEEYLKVAERACDLGDGVGCYEAKKYDKGIKVMTSQCEDDKDPDSCRTLGIAYKSGKNVPKDLKKSVEYFKAACEAGDKIGCINSEGK